MPIMDGYQATKKIREYERLRLENKEQRGFIVGLTAHSTDIYQLKSIDSGMDKFCNHFPFLIAPYSE